MKSYKYAFALAVALSLVVGDVDVATKTIGTSWFGFSSAAQARVGRPATPVSAAGVARRTTRRVIRRGAYVGTIPGGCAIGSYYGYSLYYCGGVYYQRSGGGYVIVYF